MKNDQNQFRSEPKEKILGDTANEEKETILRISGADCIDEVNAIKKSFEDLGLHSVFVNLVASTVTVRHPVEFDVSKIRQAIERTGVKIVVQEDLVFLAANKYRVTLIGSSGLLLGLGFVLDWSQILQDPFLLVILGLSAILSGALVFPKALQAALQRNLDMNVLMSVAAVGAFSIGEYSEGTTVVFLFSVAELLDALVRKSVYRT